MKSESFNATYVDAFDACKIAITKCGYKIESENKQNGIVRASAPSTIFSWGEDITVKVEKIDENATNVAIESSPKAQLFDWGKGVENENRIMDYIIELLST